MSAGEIERLFHELRVYQAELEMQNEALRTAHAELEAAKDRLSDLYDFAPVGYVQLSPKGLVDSANRTAEQMLAASRSQMTGRPFSVFVEEADHPAYFQLLRLLHEGRRFRAWQEAGLKPAGGATFPARLEGRAKAGKREIRLAISDISEKKQAEEELEKARNELRELARHIQRVREEERTAMAREIHDDMGQVLLSMKMGLSNIEQQIPEADTEILGRIRKMKDSLARTIKSTKSLITRLRPYALDELGLLAALESAAKEFEEQSGIRVDFFHAAPLPNLDRERETALFRICQEGLANAGLHSGADHVVVHLTSGDGAVQLTISDNGSGIQDRQTGRQETFGIIGMRERALCFGGDVRIEGGSVHGTRLTARIPVNRFQGA